MEKASTDQKFGFLDEKLDEKFDQYQSLTEREKALRDMLQKAEQEKAAVPEKIYQKVIKDYEGQLSHIEKEMAPIEEKIAEVHESTAQDLNSLESDLETLEEQHAEALFRHKVGEYNKEKLEEIEQSILPQIEEKKSRKEPLAGLLSRIESITSRESRESHEETASSESDEGIKGTGILQEEITQKLINEALREETPYEPESVTLQEDAIQEPEAESPREETTHEPESETPQEETPQEGESVTPQEETTQEPEAESSREETTQEPESETPQEETPQEGESATPQEETTQEPEAESSREEITQEPEPNNKLADDSDDADFISELADPMDETYEAVQDDSPAAVAVDTPPQEQPAEEIAKKPETRGESTAIAFPNLIITSGSQSGKKIPLLPMTMTIGREHDNNIELKDEEVARYHARVVYDEGNFILQDLNSSTGTWVNGEQISEVILQNSDKIRFGQTEMVIDFS